MIYDNPGCINKYDVSSCLQVLHALKKLSKVKMTTTILQVSISIILSNPEKNNTYNFKLGNFKNVIVAMMLKCC